MAKLAASATRNRSVRPNALLPDLAHVSHDASS